MAIPRAARVRTWSGTTPARLRRQSILVTAMTTLLLLIGCGVLAYVQVTVSNVQQRTVNAIVGVQRMHAWLAAADRSAANSYLSGGAELTLPQQQYEADVAAASRELARAAERGPAGPSASQRLGNIAQSLGEYQRLVDTAAVERRLGNSDGIAALRAASDQMHRPGDGILAQVEVLGDLYGTELTRANLTLEVSAAMLAVFAALAVVVVAALLRTQRFVRLRFRRRRNIRLAAATLTALTLVTGTVAGAVMAGQSISQSQGQYARLLNLWHARSLAYDANGYTSLSLIAGMADSAAFDRSFQAETERLVDQPLTDQLLEDAQRGDVRFGGLLADELKAAGSAPERAATLQVLRSYRQFLTVDSAVRAEAAAGHHAAAMTLTLGNYGGELGLAFRSLDWGPHLGAQRDWSEGQLGFAFEAFDWDLAQLTQMLQGRFDATIAAAERVLAGTLILQLLSLGVAGLTYAGLRPRIEEYSA
jgi:hypothetical protein